VSDQVCRHCGFAGDTHARHCPVFEAALAFARALPRRQEAVTKAPMAKENLGELLLFLPFW